MAQHTSSDLELFQFSFSPYCEKIRWALDVKGLKAKQRNFLPGMQPRFLGCYQGECMTPTLKVGGHHIQPSGEILEFIEIFQPFPTLFPVGDAEYVAALDLQKRFDFDWGPKLQKLILLKVLETPDYAAAFWSRGHSPSERRLYERSFAMASTVLERQYNLGTQRTRKDGEKALVAAMDHIEASLDGGDYLFADRFTGADLVAASFLAPFARPAGAALSCPDPLPEPLGAWFEEFRDHPALCWTRRLYDKWRSPRQKPAAANQKALPST